MPKNEHLIKDDAGSTEQNDLKESLQETDLKNKSVTLSSSFYKAFSILIISLSFIIIALTIITFFFHPGEPNENALFFEQMFGFILASFGLVIGVSMLIYSYVIKRKKMIFYQKFHNDE